MFSKSFWRNILFSTAAFITLGITSQNARADIPDEKYQAVLSHLLTSVLPAKFDVFHSATVDLANTMGHFCRTPDQSGLEDAQTAFHEAMDIWQELQPWRMGPMVANGRDQHIEYWPDKHGTATRQFRKLMFNKPAAYTDPEKLAGASAALQGFPALEGVLFEDKHGKQMIAADTDGIFLCQYATAIAINLTRLSGELQTDWPEFSKAMSNAGPDSMDYPSAKFAATDLYRALHEGLLIISRQKLARPLGDDVQDARASRAENELSKRSLRNIEHNLIGLFAIYDGKWGDTGQEGAGLVALIDSSLLDRSFRLNWKTVSDAVANLPPSVSQLYAQPDGYATLSNIKEQIDFLTTLVENDVGGNTQLGGGFNALDGD